MSSVSAPQRRHQVINHQRHASTNTGYDARCVLSLLAMFTAINAAKRQSKIKGRGTPRPSMPCLHMVFHGTPK
jgi:hypothetical protein